MLPRFLAKGAVNSFYFYDYDRQGWVTNEPTTARAEDWARHEAEIEPTMTFEEIEALPDGVERDYQLAISEPEPAPIEPIIRRRV